MDTDPSKYSINVEHMTPEQKWEYFQTLEAARIEVNTKLEILCANMYHNGMVDHL